MKLVCALVVLCYIYIADAVDLLVSLPYGTVKGKELVSPGNKTFRAFLGIPYAAAPVGPLRFKEPQKPYKWKGIRNTITDGNICYSTKKDSKEANEDCLFINVYTPILDNSSTQRLPVMLWMYGGAFRTGSSKYNNFGPDYFIEKDVLVASFNYRLGPFGFLATEDGVIPGNAGLKDQAFAIKWINNYIALFGGDPASVTIFGQSAGGASVGYQLLYKENKGLINGAILQSGSPLSSFSFMGDISARAYAFDLATQIDKSIDFANDTGLLVNFLINVTGEQIHQASKLTTVTSRPLPVIEKDSKGAFLTKESFEMLLAGDFLKIPIMAGTTSEEAIYGFQRIESVNISFTSYDKDHSKFVPSNGFHLKTGKTYEEVGEKIYQLYFANVSPDERLGYFVRYKSDNQYSKPMIKHADLASKYTDVYFYLFSYHGLMGNWNFSVPGADLVGHGEDDKYIWKIKSKTYSNADLSIFPKEDRITHERLITLWTNFAKYLNPTPENSPILQNVIWPKVKPGNFQYLDIGKDLVVRKDPKSQFYAGWTKIYEQYNKRPFSIF